MEIVNRIYILIFFKKGEKKEERFMKKGKIKNIGYRFD